MGLFFAIVGLNKSYCSLLVCTIHNYGLKLFSGTTTLSVSIRSNIEDKITLLSDEINTKRCSGYILLNLYEVYNS